MFPHLFISYWKVEKQWFCVYSWGWVKIWKYFLSLSYLYFLWLRPWLPIFLTRWHWGITWASSRSGGNSPLNGSQIITKIMRHNLNFFWGLFGTFLLFATRLGWGAWTWGPTLVGTSIWGPTRVHGIDVDAVRAAIGTIHYIIVVATGVGLTTILVILQGQIVDIKEIEGYRKAALLLWSLNMHCS